jgi:hypothetical protein
MKKRDVKPFDNDVVQCSVADPRECIIADKQFRWIRLTTPYGIPKYLVEQLKDREYDVDNFYSYLDQLCLANNGIGVFNPLTHLYGLSGEDGIQGFLWFVIDPLTSNIQINNFSIDPQLWNRGESIECVRNLVSSVRENMGLGAIQWYTSQPSVYERFGFKRSKHVLMEYQSQEGDDGKFI